MSEWCSWGRPCCHRHYAGRVEGPPRGLGAGDGVNDTSCDVSFNSAAI